MNKYILFGYL